MPKNIVLHPTLGVNPRLSVTVCRLCGREEEGKDLFLLGDKDYVVECADCGAKVYGGMNKEGYDRFVCPNCGHVYPCACPGVRRALGKHENIRLPGVCGECEGYMARGILLIQVEGQEGYARRTGRIAVVREEAIPRMLPEGPMRDSVLKDRAAFIPAEVWAALGLPGDETQPQETGDDA